MIRSAVVLMLLDTLLITRAMALTPTPHPTPTATAASGACIGDCDENGQATVNELLMIVNIVLGNATVASCPAGDADGDGAVQITEIIAAVDRALNGCAGPVPTPTPDPIDLEYGTCYESSDCFPCEVYPCRPFAASRGFCCSLARHGGTFSWCPADLFDPSSGACTQCAFPCK